MMVFWAWETGNGVDIFASKAILGVTWWCPRGWFAGKLGSCWEQLSMWLLDHRQLRKDAPEQVSYGLSTLNGRPNASWLSGVEHSVILLTDKLPAPLSLLSFIAQAFIREEGITPKHGFGKILTKGRANLGLDLCEWTCYQLGYLYYKRKSFNCKLPLVSFCQVQNKHVSVNQKQRLKLIKQNT